jgi:hypothetical protein
MALAGPFPLLVGHLDAGARALFRPEYRQLSKYRAVKLVAKGRREEFPLCFYAIHTSIALAR